MGSKGSQYLFLTYYQLKDQKMKTSRSDARLTVPINQSTSQHLPSLTARVNHVNNLLLTNRKSSTLLSSPIIERSKKTLLLMREINPLNQSIDSSDGEDSIGVLKRLQSGKVVKMLPELTVVRENRDRTNFLQQPLISERLVGEQAVSKFYQRYKHLGRQREKQDFLNEKHAITSIVDLLQMHNFTPRKLTLVKMKGEQAILDLKKLGLGQGSLGPVVSQILMHVPQFEQIDLSYNRIDATMAESIVERLGRNKKVGMSHNRISKVGCQLFSQLFMTSTTKIEYLNLQENNLLDNAGAVLVQNLLAYGNLKVLNLNKNFLGTKFATEMKQTLRGGDKQLSQLYLSWNQFTSKAVKSILEGLTDHSYLKVFDFSWNKIHEENVPLLVQIFREAANLVHTDFSFCQLKRQAVQKLSLALSQNQTLYGLHFEGNSGYVDHKGFLVTTEKQFSDYPLPIIKGIIRRINGVRPHQTNKYNGNKTRDVCWICHSWQQQSFIINYTQEMKRQATQLGSETTQCFIHFQHEEYSAIKMNFYKDNNSFQLNRMMPIGQVQFFLTFSPTPTQRIYFASPQFDILSEPLALTFSFGGSQVKETIMERNRCCIGYTMDPIDEGYYTQVDIAPRSADSGVQFRKSERQKKKRKVIREQKVQMTFKDLDNMEDDQFLKDQHNRQGNQDYIHKCIEYDVQNSKIPRLIKEESQINQFKIMMLRYYRHFKEVFYYLSRGNPSANSVFSITQLQLIGFLDDQKYVTKRVTLPKIMLKLYACLSAGDDEPSAKVLEGMASSGKKDQKNAKLISRPQFLQFLVRLAMQKWCAFKPKPKKAADREKVFDEDDRDLLVLKAVKAKGQRGQRGDKRREIKKVIRQVAKVQIKPQEQFQQGIRGQQEGDVEEEGQKTKLNLPLPLIEGIQRTMKTLVGYGENYGTSSWRVRKYLKVDMLIVLKVYDEFLNSLYFKYSTSKYKTNKPKKLSNLLTLDQVKNMFLDTDIWKTKEAMKQVEQAFLDAKQLPIEDGNLQFGLTYDEFQQMIARTAEFVWFNPPAAVSNSFWNNQLNRRTTPLFLRLQSLVSALYWRTPDLHNRRMSKVMERGMFEVQIKVLMQKIESLGARSGQLGLYRRNSMLGDEEDISLKEVIEELKYEYGKKVVCHEQEEEYEEEVIL